MLRMFTCITGAHFSLDLDSFWRHGLCVIPVSEDVHSKAPKSFPLGVPIVARFGALESGDFSVACCLPSLFQNNTCMNTSDLTIAQGGSEKEVP